MTQGFLTTHVLDTSAGLPAAGMKISLYRLEDGDMTHIIDTHTNADGRTDSPILPAASFAVGRYQLVFHAGAYFDAQDIALPEPKFLDEVVISFGLADKSSHYHVPLLISPYGYSTYRGS